MFYYYWKVICYSINYKLKFNNNKTYLSFDSLQISTYHNILNIHSLNMVRSYTVLNFLTKQYPKIFIGSFSQNGLKIKYTKCLINLRKNKLYAFLKFFCTKFFFLLKKKNIIINTNYIQKSGNYTFFIKNLSNILYFLPLNFYNWESPLIFTLKLKSGNTLGSRMVLSSLGLEINNKNV